MCCQAPHSDGLLHPGHLFVTLRAGSAQRPREVLAVAWDSEGAKGSGTLAGSKDRIIPARSSTGLECHQKRG